MGEPVPLAEIHAAVDRVFDGEEVRINPASVGYRSAFFGAVLQSMPGVEVLQKPQRARLAERIARPDTEWEYDELVLSLDQYIRSSAHVAASDPEIVALSDLLGRLPVHDGELDRSPEATLGMLHRWRDIDTAFEGLEPPRLGTAREKPSGTAS